MKAILTYHSIDGSGSVISVTPDDFGRHLQWLAANGVAVVPLPELVHRPSDSPAVAITFDDAYTNFETEAWPRLRDRGFPATLYVPTHFVGRANTWPALPGGHMPRLPILGWPSLARLQEEGVSLGAHTRTHPDLRRLDRAALEREVAGSVDDIRRETGVQPASFAYPYGFWSAEAASAVQTTCACAVTTELRALGPDEDRYALPRLDAFYLNGWGSLEKYGRWTFRQYFRARLLLRTLRQLTRSDP